MKKALITGITGQDGSYLAEMLLEEGYEVHGIVRRAALEDPERRFWRIRAIVNDLILHSGSLESHSSLYECVRKSEPDELYHLGAHSFVSYSFEEEYSGMETNISSTHSLLSAVRQIVPECRFYFACSSEVFGNAQKAPQEEGTPFNPRSAYGISKVAGYHLVKAYRENHGVHSVSGILFNHESPRRGFEFVTRKITSQAAAIKRGQATQLMLGNLKARRDWGHAKDYAQAILAMNRVKNPCDYVIATGKTHSVEDVCRLAFSYLDLDYREFVKSDEQLYRSSEEVELRGNAKKAMSELGWRPSVAFEDLVKEMTEADLARLKK